MVALNSQRLLDACCNTAAIPELHTRHIFLHVEGNTTRALLILDLMCPTPSKRN